MDDCEMAFFQHYTQQEPVTPCGIKFPAMSYDNFGKEQDVN